ncbi:MAG: polysaccharide biosynthesis C-terminal domain-containing protein [Sporolactobacillus sp.]|jgi:O-antigen/teichoic acid export membrane protein|nr:polysaccharide biosynthesis C-terminal domain-containing protein [Sporolactobacillus sp.]
MNRYKKLVVNSFIFTIGNLGMKLISLLLIPLYTYYLSTQQFGTADLVQTTLNLLYPIFTLSIADAVLRFVMDKSQDKNYVLNNAIVLVLLGNAFAWLLYPLLNVIFPFNAYLIYLYILLFTQSLNGVMMQFVKANGQVKIFASIGIIGSVTILVANILFLVFLHMGISGYLLSLIISDFVSFIILMSIGRVYQHLSISIDFLLIKAMTRYSIPLVPNALMWWIMGVSDRYFITFYLGLGANGLYAVANKIPNILSMLNFIFFPAWQISAIEEAKSKSKSAFYSNVFNVLATGMFVGTSLLLLFLKPIMRIVISPAFFKAWEYVPFLLVGVIFSTFANFLGTNYIAAKNTIGIFRTSIYGAAVNVGINVLLLPIMGTLGASISTMLSFLVIWLFRIAGTRSFITINIDIKKLIGNLSLIALQIVLLYINPPADALWQFVLFLLLLFINQKEIKLLYKKGAGLMAKR